MANGLKAPVMAIYHGVVEPLLALRRRRARLAAFGGLSPGAVPAVELSPRLQCAACDLAQGAARDVLTRYVAEPARPGRFGRAGAALAARARLTPMAIDLRRFPTFAAFEAHLKARSSRTLPKVRKAARLGYRVARFPLRRHVFDVHAVKTSKPVRAAGPVLDYWLLKPEHIGRPATKPVRLAPPDCAEHWSLWWGAFLDAPGHAQGAVIVDERLVGYMKLTRIGELVHYTDLMGHADHLDAGVMALMHAELMRWLIESGDPLAAGVRVVLYGAAEHGGEGLLTWKKRAGFEPLRLVAAEVGSGADMLSSRCVAR